MKRVKPALRLSKAGRNFKYDEHGKLAMLIFKETLCLLLAQKNEFGSCAFLVLFQFFDTTLFKKNKNTKKRKGTFFSNKWLCHSCFF